jgi:dTDP-glucose pyrophosphorylase/CBS domain-containing protein
LPQPKTGLAACRSPKLESLDLVRLKTLTVPPTATIHEAMRVIDEASMQICFVVDEQFKLLGSVTDGDIRRAILHSVALDQPVSMVMNPNPVVGTPDDSTPQLLAMMAQRGIRQLPLVDGSGAFLSLVTRDELTKESPGRDNWVVIMAGGLGSRLRPLTDHMPKPLLQVGRRPLLETIIDSLVAHEFQQIFISVNYLADKIKNYFGDGSRFGARITYVEETQRMGTAGALGLLPARPTRPFLVINGDVLTKVNYGSLLSFHQDQGAVATMGVREYEFQVPYGVVNTNGLSITSIDEKPVHTFLINAGLYVLSPEALDLIPGNGFFDMPDLFRLAVSRGMTTQAFPIREYWMDIGKPDDFARANGEYDDIF